MRSKELSQGEMISTINEYLKSSNKSWDELIAEIKSIYCFTNKLALLCKAYDIAIESKGK